MHDHRVVKRKGQSRVIVVRGAREHNLCNIDVELPRDKLIVFTGVSGSGKSSLAFDTLYAEGQRRYVESLSSYARQFLGQMEKPHVDYIGGLSPTIAIEQKSAGSNPRSTVGTVTEIYDYLRVLYARIGVQHCHLCGRSIGSQTGEQMADAVMAMPDGTRLLILAPMTRERKGEHRDILDQARRDGFVRVRIDGRIADLDEEIVLDKKRKHDIDVVVDRLVVSEDLRSRLTDSIETALKLSDGYLLVAPVDGEERLFSGKNSCLSCGISYPPLSPQSFSFNSPLGMCQTCNGLGFVMEPDPDLIIAHPEKSILDGAIGPWGELDKKKNSWTYRQVKVLTEHFGIDLTTPLRDIPEEKLRILMHGSDGDKIRFVWKGANSEFKYDKEFRGLLAVVRHHFLNSTSEYVRSKIAAFISRLPCPDCNGRKLRPESLAVLVGGRDIHTTTAMSIAESLAFFKHLELGDEARTIARDLLREINGRLQFLMDVGLHYLTLNRAAPSLSGGETQRIRLASQIGCGLVGVTYVLDEPTIGLHQRDNQRLLATLINLRDMGNTVIVVEHDRDIMAAADYLVDFGPGAGIRGGRIVAAGPLEKLLSSKKSLTARYLSGELEIGVPATRRQPDNGRLTVTGARHHNLKNITVEFPLGVFVAVTGVSGSGKSSLVNETLYPALAQILHRAQARPGAHEAILGLELVNKVIDIDQKPIGRTPRSNPATYVKVYDLIRRLFAGLPEAKMRGYRSGRFSFNVKGGRCEVCKGAGVRRIEMHFLADVFVTCEACGGRRFNRETLEVKFKGLSIADILELEVTEALALLRHHPAIRRHLETLKDVGLGYMKLGQPATTLSGGEAQRVKLAKELSRIDTGRTVYILDEPTTGLHFHDVKKLLAVLQRLVDKGNTVIVIEHNMDVIKCADHIIDLGPEGGDGGGRVVATGPPELVAAQAGSFTAPFLARILENRS
ncbi:excinuclease ABC subunit UvrA [bacterium]|nr:excinuclease ABC subunit UvrA [candidate division CSSED10-310 bacterium]